MEKGKTVVLVGDAAENPARSTAAGRPQLRGLTEPGEMCTPRAAVRPILLTTACPMVLYTVSAQQWASLATCSAKAKLL